MFTHHNNPGKCEWIGGALDAFAQYYNEKSATNYTLTKCLDIIAIVGTTPKEPEVLLTDKSNSRKMVIERKSVVWPKSYIYRHELEHEFAKLIWEGAKGFSDAGYRLSVEMRDFNKLTGMRIREAGKQIGEEISRLTPADLPVRNSIPISWSLRKLHPGEEEVERIGIIVSQSKSMTFDDHAHEEAMSGMPLQVQVQIDAAAAKFDRYSEHVRLVLLDFFCTELSEDDVPPMMEKIVVPNSVDEVWRTIRDWVSADEYRMGYNLLFRRLH